MNLSKVAILGFGVEGRSLLKFLKQSAEYENSEVYILDANPDIKIPAGCKSQLGKDYLKNLGDFDLIFRSPGVSIWLSEIQAAIKQNIKFTSATKLFFEKFPGKIIAITGTKGKGTTSTLLYRIMKVAKSQVYLAGNIGSPMLDLLQKANKNSWAILELSSFQLWDIKFSKRHSTALKIAAILDIFPDHLDAHRDINDYFDAKLNLVRLMPRNSSIFYFSDNMLRNKIKRLAAARRHEIDLGSFDLFQRDEMKILGKHNFKNAVIAANIAQHLGIGKDLIRRVVKNFKGLEHRLEFAREINSIAFYNDSASTNPKSLLAAVDAVSQKYDNMFLICGGIDKNLDYGELKSLNENQNIKKIFLIGTNALKLKSLFSVGSAEIKDCLKNAVINAYKSAKAYVRSSCRSVVLFSPGAASFDMFKNYKDRGEAFKNIVASL